MIDPALQPLLEQLALAYFAQFSGEAVLRFFENIFAKSPELEAQARTAKTPEDVEKLFAGALGVIDANAGDGSISVNQGIVSALRKIKFDHAKGTVLINGATVSAPTISTGGGAGATGKTTIKESELKTPGTSIQVGKGASIEITGNARIDQT